MRKSVDMPSSHGPAGQILRISASEFPEARRVEMFTELYGREILRLDMKADPDVPFHADMTVMALPGMGFVFGKASMIYAGRTRQLVADGNDDLLIQIAAGRGIATQLGREVSVEGGSALALSAAEVGHSTYVSGSRFVCLTVPRRALHQRIGEPGDALLRPVEKGSEPLRLLVSYLRLLQRDAALMTPALQSLAVRHVHDIVALMFGPVRDPSRLAGLSAARLEAVKADIASRLDRVNLSIDFIAARQKISPRSVQMLFERDGSTFSDFVLNQRLTRAHDLLSRPYGASRSITGIALQCGFGDLSYFDRAFRRRFGCTPSQVRALAPR